MLRCSLAVEQFVSKEACRAASHLRVPAKLTFVYAFITQSSLDLPFALRDQVQVPHHSYRECWDC